MKAYRENLLSDISMAGSKKRRQEGACVMLLCGCLHGSRSVEKWSSVVCLFGRGTSSGGDGGSGGS